VFLHNIYSGFENILKQILQENGRTIPNTPTSHKDLIIPAVADTIISQPLADDIFPYILPFAISLSMLMDSCWKKSRY
jgi:hypothetical protein